jgi:hypothetical protein
MGWGRARIAPAADGLLAVSGAAGAGPETEAEADLKASDVEDHP